MIYLDNAATTKPCPEAVAAMTRALTEDWGNPSAGHGPGRTARALLEESRRLVCSALGPGAERGRVLFTSGGTEADNQALKCGAYLRRHTGRHIISSRVEHEAVLKSLDWLKSQGWEVTLLDPDGSGRIPLSAVEAALRPDTALVSLMLVNNETGGVNDLPGLRRLLKERQSAALLHTDAVQAFLKLPFSPKTLGADLISLSSHKIHGPKGAGALWVAEGVRLPAFIHGGGQEQDQRSGTEAMPALAGFGAAAAATAARMRESGPDHYAALRALLQENLPGARLVGDPAACAAHICCVSLPGCRAEVLQNWLDSQGVCVSRGSACAKGRRSHVLEAIGLPPAEIDGALRVSFCPETTAEEVLTFCRLAAEAKARFFH